MKTLTATQKEIKEMFDVLNTKSISNRKYESLLQEIGRYATSKNEDVFFKGIVRAEILKNMEK